jgi:hypothetical protein
MDETVSRIITYERHEFHGPSETRTAPLEVFVYDVPHLDACGVFPPHHILNQILLSGGGDGGMSPGASWEPFEMSTEEYAALLPRVLKPDLDAVRTLSRFGHAAWKLDPEFDEIEDRLDWLKAVCDKHRGTYRAENHP